ncbi:MULTISPECIES: flagellar basal body L-ring protein FlgH [Paracoccaceae]|jgi:flagellar L-ring protein precursor FlgH|uniref:flagellar basal body L-ring protein FlgH n=1 Tax=Rhodobacterales TaxID=204455 RepID=UPI001B0F2B37|nr:flagellar basal body L-ring protein FlgH [Boseongicola sp. H5]MBO6603371.1 flagellar basal body L-ring protein FlgH [Roseicyclus sp.]MBO6625053.1 flagellar basal body L-ring protein FlgH [Roseicyclus sp.]MBO6923556.1 flagellar basal body L-ring protein FlgH [Roseicyclus sp.]
MSLPFARLGLPVLLGLVLIVAGCARLEDVGRAPALSSPTGGNEILAMTSAPFPVGAPSLDPLERASLWTAGRRSLLGDRRAGTRGDIVTVVIEIDESAEISNSTARSRNGSEQMSLPSLFGIPQRLDERLPDGASMADAVSTNSSSSSGGDGSVRRNEELTLRIAATVTDVLQNGVLRIEGSQEVRVNFEIRELLISGFVRPEDISRVNEITYDKIAAARISYGGRGQITDVQQPRYGQQVADILLPF